MENIKNFSQLYKLFNFANQNEFNKQKLHNFIWNIYANTNENENNNNDNNDNDNQNKSKHEINPV